MGHLKMFVACMQASAVCCNAAAGQAVAKVQTPVTPGTAIGNVEVVPPLLRLEGSAAITSDPVAVLALPSHKGPLARFLLLLACTVKGCCASKQNKTARSAAKCDCLSQDSLDVHSGTSPTGTKVPHYSVKEMDVWELA